jgi:eukaryotic-like serine/threonine-protein kinase
MPSWFSGSVSPATRQLAWMDRSGRTVTAVDAGGSWRPPRISPDGTRAVVAKLGKGQKNAELWIVDPSGKVAQSTGGLAQKGSPVWSPDGSRIAYFANRDGNYEIVVSPANAGSKVEPLLKSAQAKYPTDWSRDGKILLFGVLSEGTRSDVSVCRWRIAVQARC